MKALGNEGQVTCHERPSKILLRVACSGFLIDKSPHRFKKPESHPLPASLLFLLNSFLMLFFSAKSKAMRLIWSVVTPKYNFDSSKIWFLSCSSCRALKTGVFPIFGPWGVGFWFPDTFHTSATCYLGSRLFHSLFRPDSFVCGSFIIPNHLKI